MRTVGQLKSVSESVKFPVALVMDDHTFSSRSILKFTELMRAETLPAENFEPEFFAR